MTRKGVKQQIYGLRGVRAYGGQLKVDGVDAFEPGKVWNAAQLKRRLGIWIQGYAAERFADQFPGGFIQRTLNAVVFAVKTLADHAFHAFGRNGLEAQAVGQTRVLVGLDQIRKESPVAKPPLGRIVNMTRPVL